MSIALKVAVTGLKQLRKQMAKASEETQGAISASIYQKGLAIMGDSKEETPVQFGFLRGSGYVAPPKSIKDPVVEIGFGKKYAAAVHETYGEPRGPMTDAQRRAMFAAIKARGDKKSGGTGKKFFLKDPMNRHKSGYTRWIQRKARENARRGISWKGVPGSEPTRPSENRKG